MSARPLRLGTRASALASWQAQWVADQLRASGVAVELVPITTSGDRLQNIATPLEGTGLFTKEIQRALLEDQADLAVHSLKDLPTEPIAGLVLAAVPKRATVADVIVSQQARSIAELPLNARVGTGSVRRQAQVLHVRSDLQMLDIRGNVDTRLGKLERGEYDALVLAEAGLERLGLAADKRHRIPVEIMLPAVGQGALGIECRDGDETTRRALALLDDRPSHQAVLAERAMLAALRGGCMAPVAGWARRENIAAACDVDMLILTGRVMSADGRDRREATHRAPADQCESLGRRVADNLIKQGAAELIAAARG